MKPYSFSYLGEIFFEDREYQYLPPLQNANETSPSKIEVSACPLCNSKYFMTIGKFQFDAIIEKWVKRCKFNPIADVYRHDCLEKRKCLNCGLYFYDYHLPDSPKLYEELMRAIPYYPAFRWEYGVAAQFIEKVKPASLLEIGCGTGNFLDIVRHMVPRAIGSEYNIEAAKVCRAKGLEVLTDEISTLKEKFDIVCAFEVLEHVFETEDFICKLLDLLKPGGKLMFGVPNPEGILSVNGIGVLNLPPHHQYDFSHQAFEYLAKRFNLQVVEYTESELDYYQYAHYVENISHFPLTEPDIVGFEAVKQKFSGHSHFVVFEK